MNKRIQNHSSALNVDEIWAAIEPQVDEINAQRKKRKPLFIYWLSGLFLLAGLGIAGIFFINANQPDNKDNAEQIAAPVESSESSALTTEDNNSLKINKEKTPATKGTTAPTTQNGNLSPNIETVAKRTNASTKLASEAFDDQKRISESTLQNIVKSEKSNNTTAPALPLTAAVQKNTAVTPPEISDRAAFISMINPKLKSPASDLPALNFSIKNNGSLLPLYVEKPTFSIELQTGISNVSRTLSSTGNPTPGIDTLVSLRNTFEEPLEALHANLLVNAHFPSGFYVSSGVAFTQISERYRNNSTVVDSIVDPMGVQKLIINITGDTIPVIGPVTTTQTTTFTKRFYNTYRMIDIPVFIGYQYDFGDWKTDFSLGIFANILLATEGRIPDTPTTDFDLTANGGDIYRSRVDYSLQFGLGVSKRLTDKLSIRINPMFRYYSRNFIKEDIGLDQRYLLFGGTVGLRMDL